MKCELCKRELQTTRHHLRPRTLHSRLKKKGFTQLELNVTVDLCRDCHHMVHEFFTEKELAKNFYTLELLLESEKVRKYVSWVECR